MSFLGKILLGVDRDLLEEDGLDVSGRCEQIVVLAQLHCVPSMVELFNHLMRPEIGIRPNRVVIVPKPYSTIPSALDSLRKSGFFIVDYEPNFRPGNYDGPAYKAHVRGCVAALKICRKLARPDQKVRLIVLDDGGMLTETLWRLSNPQNSDRLKVFGLDASVFSRLDIISVQQTASGIRRNPDPAKLTKIDIARSAAKRHFESKVIAEGVLKKIRAPRLLDKVRTVGVVGVGALGAALAKDLRQRGFTVYAYDESAVEYPDGVTKCSSLKFLLREADVIFGCTGQNFMRIKELEHVRPKKPIHFISCSSRDVEFKDLLQFGQPGDGPFDRVSVTLPDGQVHTVENGGFPINFDRKAEQEGPKEIALTRALVFTGVLQAIYLKDTRGYGDALMLAPRAQRLIVDSWMSATNTQPEAFGVAERDFDSLDWWREHSGGWVIPQEPKSPQIFRPTASDVFDSPQLALRYQRR